jgi:hypothetical protein
VIGGSVRKEYLSTDERDPGDYAAKSNLFEVDTGDTEAKLYFPIDSPDLPYEQEKTKWGYVAAKRMRNIRGWEKKNLAAHRRRRSKHDKRIFDVIHDNYHLLMVPEGSSIQQVLRLRKNINILRYEYISRFM